MEASESAPENSAAVSRNGGNLDLVLGVEVDVSVQLGTSTMTMGEVLNLEPGDVIQLREKADAPVLLCLNDKVVARGEVVLVEEKLGLKITEMLEA